MKHMFNCEWLCVYSPFSAHYRSALSMFSVTWGIKYSFVFFRWGEIDLTAFIYSANTVSRPTTLFQNILHCIWECVWLLHFSLLIRERNLIWLHSSDRRTCVPSEGLRPFFSILCIIFGSRCGCQIFSKRGGIGLPVFSECVLALHT